MSVVVAIGSALLGALVGGWVTWKVADRASADQARLAAHERLDASVQELALAATEVGRSLERVSPVDLRRMKDAAGIVSARARSISPHLVVVVESLVHQAEAASIGPDPAMPTGHTGTWLLTKAWDQAIAVPSWAVADACHEWLADSERFEGDRTPPDAYARRAREERFSDG